MITFNRTLGNLATNDGHVFATGIWSGHGEHANVIGDEQLGGLGPLPAGLYKVGKPRDGGHLGPFVMDLTQVEGDSFGRSLFRIHGAAAGDVNHASSDGCVIAGHDVRVQIDKELNGYRFLKVV